MRPTRQPAFAKMLTPVNLGYPVATHSEGDDVHVTGLVRQASGDPEFGPGEATLAPRGGVDVFVARHPVQAGETVWARLERGSGQNRGEAIAVRIAAHGGEAVIL